MKKSYLLAGVLALTGCLMTAFPAMAAPAEANAASITTENSENNTNSNTENDAVTGTSEAAEETKIIVSKKSAADTKVSESSENSEEETVVPEVMYSPGLEDAEEKADAASANADSADDNADGEDEAAEGQKTEASVPLGRRIADFALQFVGNRYRYGGTSLTGGTDCSGFTMSVYQNFGVSLPHSSRSQRSSGTAVGSLAEAEPGDLICYSGHVALYLGNGRIVHAQNARKGITTSDATYQRILAIRRVI